MTRIAELASSLAALADQLAPGGGAIEGLTRLSGGASLETWSFDIAGQGFVLRREPIGYGRAATKAGLSVEAELMRLAAAAGAPSPRVRLTLRPEHGLGEGFIMDRVEGETIAKRLLRDEAYAAVRPTLARRFGELLAAIHAIPATAAPALRVAGAQERLGEVVEIYETSGSGRPVFELAIQWLRQHMPEPTTPKLVHGDFRTGNLIVGPEGVRAILDWEVAHLGDPMEYLGWVCVNSLRFVEINKPVGGFGQRQALFEGYQAVSGHQVEPGTVRWWQTLGSLSWGASCALIGVDDHAKGDRPVERAMIGRRASECEIDLLRLLLGED